jgi:hypothetical protein
VSIEALHGAADAQLDPILGQIRVAANTLHTQANQTIRWSYRLVVGWDKLA